MKKFLSGFIFIVISQFAVAQLNNSWIDYTKTYFKFPLAKDTACRINQPALAAAGLANTPAQDFQLWRNGKQVRLYTSVTTGILGVNDYIEFWGEMNDGKPDKDLYRDADYQLSEKFSLETDTAIYFLTVNAGSANLRYVQSPNIITPGLSPDAYFMRRIEEHYRASLNRGYAAVIGEYVYSSSYDIGEGWVSRGVGFGAPLTKDFAGINKYPAGPANSVTFTVGASGNALYARDLFAQFFNTTILQKPMPFFDYLKDTVRNIPLSLLASNNSLPVRVGTNGANINDQIVVSNISVTYPATFNFNNEKSFYFELAPSATGNYLKIANFNHGGQQPVLFDYTNGRRYLGDISLADTVQFVLPASAEPLRKFNLISQNTSNIYLVQNLTSKTFIDYNAAANRGDYLIISHPVLYNNGSGVNNVELYRQYRNSADGGGFNAKIYDINELTDQFAFGIKKHPAAVRDFIRYVNQQYTIKPKYLFIIGRGMGYADYTLNQSSPVADQIDLIPSFGWPASDILLVAEPRTQVPLISIGRLGAVNGNEVGVYLSKIKEHETLLRSNDQTLNTKGWMKNVLFAAGPATEDERIEFTGYLDGYKSIIQDTLYGGNVTTIVKSSVVAIEQQQSLQIEQLMNSGVGIVKYFGHSSANDLAVNLNFPQNYTNIGKYPFFHVSGCTVGNFYGWSPLRPTGFSAMSLSEKYVLLANKGSIGFLGSTHWGIAPFLNFYNTPLIRNIARDMYGNSIGDQIKDVITTLGSNPGSLDYYTRVHLEEINFHGDPALKLFNFPKPDYVIEDPLVKLNPNIITVADNSFTVDIKMRNIGRAVGDSIRVTVKHQLPNDTVKVLYNRVIPSIRFVDSVFLTVLINPITDKGLNKLIITLDDGNRIDEVSEMNNVLIKEFYIFEDELRPISPYNYSIVNQQNITYYASTANPLGGLRQYSMEIDTTENFNSAFKKSYSANGIGGIVEFKPTNLNFTDSVVYYWRVAVVPVNNANYIWNTSSFVYLANSSTGFNQSHYFQYKKNIYQDVVLDNDRVFKYTPKTINYIIKNAIFPASNQEPDFAIYNEGVMEQSGFYAPFASNTEILRFFIIDSITSKAWVNTDNGTSGQYGSVRPIPLGPVKPGHYHFKITNTTERQNVMNFIDLIPSGNLIVMVNCPANPFTFFPPSWRADTLALGSGVSLYHKLKNIGWTLIDSLKTHLPFVFITKKGTNVAINQTFGTNALEKLSVQFSMQGRNLQGEFISDKLGPAKTWQDLSWRGRSIEPVNSDKSTVDIIGVDVNGGNTTLATISVAQDTTLSWINATTYPYLRLKMVSADSSQGTPSQLKYWKITATMIPEGAVAPNILYAMRDTVEQGEKIDFKLAFKNISQTSFDSTMKFNFIITDRNNVPHPVSIPRGKILVAGDTLSISHQIDTKNYPGLNTLFVDVNPNNHQPELSHFNNVLYKDFYVKPDTYNPFIDVTFDGVHILNKDIVAAKPHIVINLKDESRFLALADTALLRVQVKFPDGNIQDYHFGDIMTFTSANLATGKNTATIDFRPTFVSEVDEGSAYELIVTGKDVVGNKAGDIEYHVSFTVISKAMISNLLNYPNPFTTSTAFVFTLTGNEVPQNLRIQIMTITGKIVREITKDELGPLHVGRNITEFKWDGTDAFGQKLANGVYLYRVITNLNGKSLEKYKAEGDNTDKYFNKGYGKMVIIR